MAALKSSVLTVLRRRVSLRSAFLWLLLALLNQPVHSDDVRKVYTGELLCSESRVPHLFNHGWILAGRKFLNGYTGNGRLERRGLPTDR